MTLPWHSVDIDIVPVLVLSHHVPEKVYVADGQLQCVHFAQSLLIGQRRDVRSKTLERFVDTLHPATLPQVGRLSLLRLLRCTFRTSQLGTTIAKGDVAEEVEQEEVDRGG